MINVLTMPPLNLPELDLLFDLQLARIKTLLNPPSHSEGPRKPSLEEQEFKLLSDLIEDEDE